MARTSITIDGTVSADGESGPENTSSCGYRPGGGGGSGGGIVVSAPSIVGNGALSAMGGNGGDGLGIESNNFIVGWAGGGGGGGRIKGYGAVGGFAGATSVAGGLGGSAPSTLNSSPGLPGEDGTLHSQADAPVVFEAETCD